MAKSPTDIDSRGPWSELLARLREGDRDVLESILDRNQRRLRLVAQARLGRALREKVHSSDVLQSAYLEVLRSVRLFDGDSEEDFVHWVVRILENTIRDRVRYFNAQKRSRASEEGEALDDVDTADPGPTPSSVAELSDELVSIARAMRRLPKDYVRVLTLHMNPQQTHRMTAGALGRTEGASRVLLARARAALLVELEQLEDDPPRA